MGADRYSFTGIATLHWSNSSDMMKRYTVLFLFLAIVVGSRADHFAGGSITTRCLGGNFHEITFQLFRDCSGVPLGVQNLHLSSDCGVSFDQTLGEPVSVEEVSPLCAADLPNSTCNGGTLVGYDLTTYRANVFLSPCANWTINWNICCRINSLNVASTPGMWIETVLNNSGGLCNEEPRFVNNSIPLVCVGQPVSYDGSATEPDGNTLRYTLIDARFSGPEPAPVQYVSGFSGEEPYPGMVIDPQTGLITFLPTSTGYVVTVVLVAELDAEGDTISTVMRDFLFVISSCANEVPSIDSGVLTDATGPATISGDRALQICSAGEVCVSMEFTDLDDDQDLTITTNLTSVLPSATIELTGTNPVTASVCWNSTGTPPGDYQFTITATDDACPVVGLQQFAYTFSVENVASPGVDTDIVTCENGGPITLFDALGGDPATGGSWTDTEGEPFDGTFVPGTSPAGSYSYTISGGECSRTAQVGVTIAPATDPDCIGLGLREGTALDLTIFPDPLNAQRIWLTAPKAIDMDLRVFTSEGRLLLTRRSIQSANVPLAIDLHGAVPGVHMLHMVDRRSGVQQTLRFPVL